MYRRLRRLGSDRRGALRGKCARFGVLLSFLALFSQALAFASTPMAASRDVREVARELGALIGPGVVICATSDDSGRPTAPMNCDERCPLCQAVAGAFAFIPPTAAKSFAPGVILIDALAFPIKPRAPPPRPLLAPRPRGPPSAI